MRLKENFIRKLSIMPLFIWQTLFVIFPILILIYNGLIKGSFLYNFNWIISSKFINILFRSFYFSFFASWLCLIIGYIVVYSIFQFNEKFRPFFILLMSIPFLSNFFVHIMSIINMFSANSLINKFLGLFSLSLSKEFLYTDMAVLFGFVYCYLPYVIFPIYIAFSKFNLNLINASNDLGANEFKTFFKILIPGTRNAIVTGFFLVFVPSFSEFAVPELMGGDKYLHSGAAIYNVLLNFNLIAHAAMMTIIFIIFLGIFSVLSFILLNKIISLSEKI